MAAKKDQQLVEFAAGLLKLGWELLGSGGTAKFLNEHNVLTKDIAVLAGAPILGHRVVSLSREIHAGLLSKPEDQDEMDRLRIPVIDLVFVDFYPTREIIAKYPDIVANYAVINENIDIGGPTAVRSAIKGGRIVVTNPTDFKRVLAWIADGCPFQAGLVAKLGAIAESSVSEYVSSVAEFRRVYAKRI